MTDGSETSTETGCPLCEKDVVGHFALIGHLEFGHGIDDAEEWLAARNAPPKSDPWWKRRKAKEPTRRAAEDDEEPQPREERQPPPQPTPPPEPAAQPQPVAPPEPAPQPRPAQPEPRPEPLPAPRAEPPPEPEPQPESELREPAPEPAPVDDDLPPIPPRPDDLPPIPARPPSDDATASGGSRLRPSPEGGRSRRVPSRRVLVAVVAVLVLGGLFLVLQVFGGDGDADVATDDPTGDTTGDTTTDPADAGGESTAPTPTEAPPVDASSFRAPFVENARETACTVDGGEERYEIAFELTGARDIVYDGTFYPDDSADGEHTAVIGIPAGGNRYVDSITVEDAAGTAHALEIRPPIYLAGC